MTSSFPNDQAGRRVRPSSQHEQRGPADSAETDTPMPRRLKPLSSRRGEGIAVHVAGALLDVAFVRKCSPTALASTRQRVDGWAELRRPDGQRVGVALEHQGAHRIDPQARRHGKCRVADPSMAEQSRRDAAKARLLSADARVVLVEVPDLVDTPSAAAVLETVADALEAKLPWLAVDAAYRERKAALERDIAAGCSVLQPTLA